MEPSVHYLSPTWPQTSMFASMRGKPARRLRTLAPVWKVARLATSPDTPECLRMLADLVRFAGSRTAASAIIGCNSQSLDDWLEGYRHPSLTARRGIWATWARFLHPELMQTTWDWMTWGRFYRPPSPPSEGENWSDWSI